MVDGGERLPNHPATMTTRSRTRNGDRETQPVEEGGRGDHVTYKWCEFIPNSQITPYSDRMSLDMLMGFYMEVLRVHLYIRSRRCTLVHGFCFFKAVSYRVYRVNPAMKCNVQIDCSPIMAYSDYSTMQNTVSYCKH